MEFIAFYIFKCHDGDEVRLKHYAGILVIEFWADLIYNMETEKAVACLHDHSSTVNALEPRQRWRGPRGRHVTIYIKYIRFYLFMYCNGAQMML